MTGFLRASVAKLLAVSILLLLVFAVVQGVITPLIARHAEARERIEEQRVLLGRLIASAEAGTAGETADGRLRSSEAQALFLAGESDATRIAGLQSRLSDAAQAAGARMTTTQSVPSREEQGVRFLGVQAALRADVKQLRDILFQLEAQQPPLLIDSLQVSRGTDSSPGAEGVLDVRLVVMGAAARKKG